MGLHPLHLKERRRRLLLLVLAVISCVGHTLSEVATTTSEGHWLGVFCSGQEDCAADECCVVGMARFSRPICVRRPTVGDQCLVGNRAENKTLHYPGGRFIQLHDVYRLFCPCEGGLGCHEAVCQPMSEDIRVRNRRYNVDDFDYSALEAFDNRNDNFVEFAS